MGVNSSPASSADARAAKLRRMWKSARTAAPSSNSPSSGAASVSGAEIELTLGVLPALETLMDQALLAEPIRGRIVSPTCDSLEFYRVFTE